MPSSVKKIVFHHKKANKIIKLVARPERDEVEDKGDKE